MIPSPGCRIQSGSQMGLWDEDIFRLPQSETVPAVCAVPPKRRVWPRVGLDPEMGRDSEGEGAGQSRQA